MPHEKIDIIVSGGKCPTYILTPAGGHSSLPAVIFYSDAGGIRPAVLEMGQRLANAGYFVLVPDIYYRYGPYGPFVPKEVFAGDFRAILGPLMATTNNEKAAIDAEGLLVYLETQSDVDEGRVGAVGFCMGGGMAIAAAGFNSKRIAAVASFHAGNLVTDSEFSPHLYVPKLEAEVYIGAADNDPSYPPEMAKKFQRELLENEVRYKAETYAGAAHGWMVPDFPVYNPVAAERGWEKMLDLFKRNLGKAA